MTDPNYLSVNFGNMDQLVSELTSIVSASRATADQYVARMNSTIGNNPANWDGPIGKDSWAALQQAIYGHVDRMNAAIDNARAMTLAQSQKWPDTEAKVANIFRGVA
jgi:uncharacterized protein YukE